MTQQITTQIDEATNTLFVFGLSRADKCLFTSFCSPELVERDGRFAFAISPRYLSNVEWIAAARAKFAASQPKRTSRSYEPRSSSRRTSSGWCEPCEDGNTAACRRSGRGCY